MTVHVIRGPHYIEELTLAAAEIHPPFPRSCIRDSEGILLAVPFGRIGWRLTEAGIARHEEEAKEQ